MAKPFVKLGNFSEMESQVVIAILEDAGILCYILGQGEITTGVGLGAVKGVEIQVPEEQLEEAQKILEEAKESE